MAIQTTTGERTESFWEDYERVFGKGALSLLRETGADIVEAKAEGACLFDDAGRRYIDCNTSAGTYNLGRRNPELLDALRAAAKETDQGNFPLVSIEKARLAKALSDFVPGSLECSVFSVLRGEAVDFACKVSRGVTGRTEFISFEGAWHGHTGFAMSLTTRDDAELYGPLIPDVKALPFNDVDAARAAISEKTAAVFVEPIQVENGCRAATPEFLRALSDACKAKGAVLVFDETQTGFGRTGSKFAFERSGIVPDALILGEALGGGVFPIAATIITQKVNAFMNQHPLVHLSTFGGSDVGCRVAVKALELYQRDKPWENAARIGGKLAAGLSALIGNGGLRAVSGKGLVLALDLESPDAAKAFCRALAQNGVMASTGLVATNTILLRPTLTLTETEAEELLGAVKNALGG